MKRKQSLYRPAAIGMSLLMTAGLTACQGGSASSDTKADKSSAKYQVTDVIHFESRQWKYSKCKGAG